MSPKISVIIPVYNTERYLSRCLDSLIHQTFSDIEIICVDDGSTDGSWDILQKYAKNDKRIVLIRQKNSGIGAARNKAIPLAHGKYITFVDSDDFLVENALEKMYQVAEKNSAQVVQCNYQFYHEKEGRLEPFDYAKYIWDIYQYDLNKEGYYCKENFSFERLSNFGWAAWGHLYLTSFLRKNNIHFSETALGEDHLFTKSCFFLADKIFFIPDYLYYYRRGIISATTLISDTTFDIFSDIADIENFLRKYNFYDDFQDDFEIYKYMNLRAVLHQVPKRKKPLFFKKCRSLLTKEDYKALKKPTHKKNFFFQKKLTKSGKVVIKLNQT